jgi:hypothetical protein
MNFVPIAVCDGALGAGGRSTASVGGPARPEMPVGSRLRGYAAADWVHAAGDARSVLAPTPCRVRAPAVARPDRFARAGVHLTQPPVSRCHRWISINVSLTRSPDHQLERGNRLVRLRGSLRSAWAAVRSPGRRETAVAPSTTGRPSAASLIRGPTHRAIVALTHLLMRSLASRGQVAAPRPQDCAANAWNRS